MIILFFPQADYTNWALWEPNDMWGEDCTEMYDDGGKWNDLDCGDRRHYMCVKGRFCLFVLSCTDGIYVKHCKIDDLVYNIVIL